MKVKVYPSKVNGTINIPPSKSMAHRAIICASLADGISKIDNINYSEDIKATIAAMRQVGAEIVEYSDHVIVKGIKMLSLLNNIIDCNESGSTLRFMIPIIASIGESVIFKGKGRLMQRPLTIYDQIFDEQNILHSLSDEGYKISGKLKPDLFEISGSISSQFITGLLFALPLLDNDSTIKVNYPFESRSYIDLTISMLQKFNICIDVIDGCDHTLYKIKGKQKYQATDVEVEGDYSQLAFYAVLAAINNNLDLLKIDHASKQGDKKIIDILKDANIKVEEIKDGYHINCGDIKNIEIDLKDCPDIGPILMVLGSVGNGKMVIKNCQRLRIKESDRIEAMEINLKKVGVNIISYNDKVIIEGKTSYMGDVVFDSFNDHRIVMSLTVFATILNKPIMIEQAEAINKSYPHFFEDIAKLGVNLEIYE